MIDARVQYTARGAGPAAGKPFVMDLHLRAETGITGVFGASGGGKTLLFSLLSGLVRPEKGRILVSDEILFDAGTGVDKPTANRGIGFVFERNCLLPHLSLKANLQFAVSGKGPREAAKRTREGLARFGLEDVADFLPARLSAVEHRVGMLAQAVLREPRALLVDAIPLDWDPQLRARFFEVLREEAASLQIPVLLATRQLDDCFEAAQQMAVLHEGKLLQQGEPGEVCRKPATLSVAELLQQDTLIPAEIVFLDPQQKRSKLAVFGAEIPGPYFAGRFKGNRITLAVPPASLRCLPRDREALLPEHVPLVLRRAVAHPYQVRLYFEEGLMVDLPQASAASLQPGARWQLQILPKAMRVL